MPSVVIRILMSAMILYSPSLLGATETGTPLRLVAFGDSLTAGYGLSEPEAFPAVLQQSLRQAGLNVEVINAGVSGDTTTGGLARLGWIMGLKPDVVLVELGANDALRGLDPGRAEANLERIIERLLRNGIRPVLAGMKAPRNLGRAYHERFDRLYPALAERHRVPLYPFFLDGVAGVPALNLTDGMHPNAAGVREIVRRMTPFLVEHLSH